MVHQRNSIKLLPQHLSNAANMTECVSGPNNGINYRKAVNCVNGNILSSGNAINNGNPSVSMSHNVNARDHQGYDISAAFEDAPTADENGHAGMIMVENDSTGGGVISQPHSHHYHTHESPSLEAVPSSPSELSMHSSKFNASCVYIVFYYSCNFFDVYIMHQCLMFMQYLFEVSDFEPDFYD